MSLTYHQRIVNLLSDGQWHPLSEIHDAVARFIDSDRAELEYHKQHPKWEQAKRAVRVQTGKRRLVLLSMLSLVYNRKIVQIGKGRGFDRQYRLTKKALASRRPAKADQDESQTASGTP